VIGASASSTPAATSPAPFNRRAAASRMTRPAAASSTFGRLSDCTPKPKPAAANHQTEVRVSAAVSAPSAQAVRNGSSAAWSSSVS
jgi:hypothetical protein